MSGDVVAIHRSAPSPVVVARLWDWIATNRLTEVSLRMVEDAHDRHGVADCWGALKALEQRGLLRQLKADGSHSPFRVNQAAQEASVSIKAHLYLEALAKAANEYHTTAQKAEKEMTG